MTAMSTQQTLRSLITYALDHDMLDTAEFTAERLLAQSQSNTDTQNQTQTQTQAQAQAQTQTQTHIKTKIQTNTKLPSKNPSIDTPTPHNVRKSLLFHNESSKDPNPSVPLNLLVENTYLYAHVLFQRGRYKASYNASVEFAIQHIGCSYVFARSCLKLNRESEGIRALMTTMHLWEDMNNFTPSSNSSCSFDKSYPDSVACYMLLAKLYHSVGDVPRASLHLGNVLKLNPFIFEAFEMLCKMGVKLKVDSIYKMKHMDVTEMDVEAEAGDDADNVTEETEYHLDDLATLAKDSEKSNKVNSSIFKTPITKLKQPNSPENSFMTPINKSSFSKRVFNKRGHTQLQSKTGTITGSGSASSRASNIPMGVGARRNASITSKLLNNSNGMFNATGQRDSFSNSHSEPFTNSRGDLASGKDHESGNNNKKNYIGRYPLKESGHVSAGVKINNVGSGSSNNLFDLKDHPQIVHSSNGVDEYTVSVYRNLAKGFAAFTAYDCFKAIRIFDSLSENEKNTPWVLSKQGRLHFEIVNYSEAENYFQKLRQIDRTRVEDMDFYSTLLWHLHKEVDLSFLSHELYEVDSQKAQTWISIGNLFSFRKEPEEAIKCFNKAIELDSKCAYAYTLQGHEYLVTDAFENALSSFRNAIVIDKRHYNAFYGIGMVYLKLGDFKKAEFHFRKALEINPVNVILICCVGVVLEKIGRREESLKQYEFACKLQPLSMLALFKKAQVLFTLQKYDEALIVFEKLENLAPDEASVHFLLGKLYKHYERKHDAIKQFTIALNLDPKGSHLIKEAMENLNDGVM